MWDKVVELAMSDGLWALLFCMLLIFELKDSRAREKKYQNTITNLSQDLGYMNTMNESIDKIHKKMIDFMKKRESALAKEES
ncbi:MAG: hypothetical protein K2G37_06860 [Clostridia bacterium]|nr:hypothetical protein [Clostridia bacterium]MDE7329414.1 hypothetical protein [Clostridia bacterium]